ncbi:GNAT family N-acetyltransferase [Bifidobacterium oedipodis]|nr:GNAT family N-acetyltransferase [Bifidobacterium sp. DSM 109957]
MMDTSVTLRAAEEPDYQLFEEWWNDFEMADEYRATTEWTPTKKVRDMFLEWDQRDDELGFGRTIVGPRGNCVGHVMVWRNSAQETDARISLFIGPYYQSHGYGSQAMRMAIAKAVNSMRLDTITARAWSFNLRARHMCESLGFKESDRRKGMVERDGKQFDAVIYTADAAMLMDRVNEEARQREEGEALEAQRFAALQSGLGASNA